MARNQRPTAVPNDDCQYPLGTIPDADSRRRSPRDSDPERKGRPQRMNVRINANFRQLVYITKTDSELVLPDDNQRVYLGIQNRGASAIFLGFGGQANENTFRLVAGGFYEPFVGPISSLHILGVAAGDKVVIIEGVS